MRLLLALLLVALPALGQSSGVVTLGIGDMSGLGFVTPFYSAGLSLERQTRLIELSAGVTWSPSDKFRARILTASLAPEWNATAQMSALFRIGPMLVGGGGSGSITRTPEYTKDAVRPHVSLGAEFPIDKSKVRVLVSHLWPGSDESNRLDGERVLLRAEIPSLNWRHRIGFEVGFWRFHQSGNPAIEYARRTWMLTLGEAF